MLSLKLTRDRILIPVIFVLEVVLLFVALATKWNPEASFPLATASFPVSVFFSLGVVLTVAGILIAYLSFYREELLLLDNTGTYDTIGKDLVTLFPMFGLIQPIQHTANLTVEFEEIQSKEVTVHIQDLITAIGADHYVTTYGLAHGVKGTLTAKLVPGKYDIYFISTDNEPRKVKVTQKLTSHKLPYRMWREIGLTLVTVGTFFLFEASLKIFV